MLVPPVYLFHVSELNELSEKKTVASRSCRDAVKRLHEVMKLLDIAKIDLGFKEKRYSMAIAIFSLWTGFAVADFVAAATVVYTTGPVTGMEPEYVFWNPEGADFMNFTWFGIALIVSVVLSFLSLCYTITCSLSRNAARKKVREMNETLRDAKSAILEVCPMELWYSGEA
jgi:hypothetical protein